MVTTRGRSTEINSQQRSASTRQCEILKVPESQFGTEIFRGAQKTFQGGQAPSEADKAMLAMVERFVQERLAQQQPQNQHIPSVQTMRGNKPQLYHGKSWSEFEEFVWICESNFFSAHWGLDQNIDKIFYASGFLIGTPASE